MEGERCKRVKAIIEEENYYLVIGSNFVHATTPYENRPENKKVRLIVDTICLIISQAMGGVEKEET